MHLIFVGKKFSYIFHKVYKVGKLLFCMKKRVVITLSIVMFFFIISFTSAEAISEDLHLNIQTTNSTGGIESGTYAFVFNISTTNDCANVVYTNSTSLTTDTRGIISYYLPNVSLNYTVQYYLCYYRDGVLKETSKIARTPYSFTTDKLDEYDSSFFMPLNTSVFGNFSFNGDLSSGGLSIIGGNLYANGTGDNYFLGNVGIGTDNPTGKLEVVGNITSNWFKGLFNWTTNSNFLSFDGSILSFLDNPFNATYDLRYLLRSEESSLNVNSSDFWDSLDSPSDINAGDIIDDGTYLLTGNWNSTNTTYADNNISLNNYIAENNASVNNYILYVNSTNGVGAGSYDDAWINETIYNKTNVYNKTEVDDINNSVNNYVDSQDILFNDSVNNYITENNNSVVNWANSVFTSISNLINLVGNWSADKPNYYNTTYVYNKTEVDDINTSVNNYVAENNNSVNNYIGSVNTSMKNYADGTFITQADEGTLNVSNSDTLDGYDSSFFMPLNNSVYGQFDYNGGWLNDGLSIIGGNLYAQMGYFYNISSLVVSHLNVNGSLFPMAGFDNQFDIGSSTLRWKDLYLSGEIRSNGTGDNYFLGNVGIGTSSPGRKLEVKNTAGNDGIRITNSNTGLGNLEFADTDDVNIGAISYDHNADFMTFRVNDSTRMIIRNDGKIGIGTASPDSKLHTIGTTETWSNGNGFLFRNAAGVTRFNAALSSDNTRLSMLDSSNNTDVFLNTAGLSYFNGGNVGINTTVPLQLLDVQGNANLGNSSTITVDRTLQITDTTNAGVSSLQILQNGDIDTLLRSDTGDSYINVQGGDLGIGTASPSQALDVSGKIQVGDDAASAEAGVLRWTGSAFQGYNGTDWNSFATTGGAGVSPWTENGSIVYYAGGNVGIGTASPDEILEVAKGSEGIYFKGSGSTGDARGLTIETSTIGASEGALHDFKIASAVGTFSFTNNDRELVRFLWNGNVGIGTTSPLVKNHIESSYSDIAGSNTNPTTSTLLLETTDVQAIDKGASIILGGRTNDGGSVLGSFGAIKAGKFNSVTNDIKGYLALYTNEGSPNFLSEQLRIDEVGNVGIGTATPNADLDIVSSSTSTIRMNRAATNLGGQIIANSNPAGVGSQILRLTSEWNNTQQAQIKFISGDDTSNRDNGRIVFQTASAGTLANAMIIDESQNVGIGTDSPQSLTQIRKDFDNSANVGTDVNTMLNIRNSDASGSATLKFVGTANRSGVISFGGATGAATDRLDIYSRFNHAHIASFVADGNVGIGTTSPNAPLAIKAGVSATGYKNGVRVNANSNGLTIRAALTVSSGDDAQLNLYDTNTILKAIIRADGDSYFNGGNVGIGTAIPEEKLDVSDGTIQQTEAAAGGTTALRLRQSRGTVASPSNSLANGVDGVFIKFQTYNSGYQDAAFITGVTDPTSIDGGKLGFYTKDIAGSVTEKMVILEDGDVGIGTTSPGSPLHINNNAIISNTLLTLESDINNAGEYNEILFKVVGGLNYGVIRSYLGSSGDSQMRFGVTTDGGSTIDEALTIEHNGNVGIGTTSPGTELHISRIAENSIISIENTGNGNSSGIDFIRERSTGTGFIGGSIFMPSITSSNSADLYIQAQTTGVGSGVMGPLVANNGVRLLLKGEDGVFLIENGATESLRILANGNVGIGDSIPDGTLKLDVEGQVGATEYCDENGANCIDIANAGGDLTEITAGNAITVTSGTGPIPTIAVTANAIGDTQLTYNTGQHLTTTSGVTFTTVNTGQGANELYDMNQNVMTTNTPTFQGIARNSHSKGHLVGSYNSVGANSAKTNPIYTIGSGYNPTDANLSNMYGIGYSNDAFWNGIYGVGDSDANWGLYVAADGDIRATISGSIGDIWTAGDLNFDGELRPDGAVCSNGQILKKTGANNWDCATDANSGGDITGLTAGNDIDISSATGPVPTISIEPTLDLVDYINNIKTLEFDSGTTNGIGFWDGTTTYTITMGNDQVDDGTVTDYSMHFNMGATANRGFTFGSSATAVSASINALTGDIHTDGDLTVSGADINLPDANTVLREGAGNSVQVKTNSGWLDIGAQNTAHAHLQTDRPDFYFNKGIIADTGYISSYNEDLRLRRANADTDYALLTTTSFDLVGVTLPGDDIADGTVDSTELQDNSIQEIDLESTNGPTNNYILSYDSGTAGFTWVADSDSGGDITGLTAGNDIDITSATGPVPTISLETTLDYTTIINNLNTVEFQDSAAIGNLDYSSASDRWEWSNGGFYIMSTVPTTWIYSPTIYMGGASGTTINYRANVLNGDAWDISAAGAGILATLNTGSGAMELGDAAVANGDVNSVPTGDQVYDFVTGLGYAGGDVDGPASATDNAIARFNGTTGKIIQNSGVTIDDSSNLVAADITTDGIKLGDSADRSGLLEVNRLGATAYTGIMTKFSPTAEWSLMGSETQFGLYDDSQNEWITKYTENEEYKIYYNGIIKFATTNTGATVIGNLTVEGNNIVSSTTTAISMSADDVSVVGCLNIGSATECTTQGNLQLSNDIIMSEDDYIGISGLERIEFNGGSGLLEILAANLDLNSNDIVGVNKLTLGIGGEIDPPYRVGDVVYATYAPFMVGVKEETSGSAQLVNGEYIINFSKLEKGSDLWLLYQVTDFGENWEKLQVILTPGFDGRAWYKKESLTNTLTIYGTEDGEVSYRLTADGFTWGNRTNVATSLNLKDYPDMGEKK